MGRAAGCLILSALVAAPACAAAQGFDFDGRPILQLRARYNHIEESDKPENTEGVTVRAIAGWRTAPYHGWRLTLEGIHTGHLGSKRFNDDPAQLFTSPYPLLPDPRYTGINEAHIEGSVAALRVRAGRQRVKLENERWISDNDFRQVPQLFDGASAQLDAGFGVLLSAGHFTRIRTTSGDSLDLRLTFANAAWNPMPGHAIAGYAIFHDQAQNGAFTGFADNSYRVIGIRAQGAVENLRGLAVPYLLEAARQSPYSGGDDRIEADYWRAGIGVAGRTWTLRFDYEVKGSNRGLYGVQMPLTDFYAFNGWALHFFNTPRQGLRDGWLTARVSFGRVTLYGETHQFRSDYRRLDFGREHDIGLFWRWTADAEVRLQHARYERVTDGTGAHVRKTWLTLSYAY